MSALNKSTGDTNNVGAAWIWENGRISIKLDAFVTLTGSKDLVLTLFPADDAPPRSQRKEPEEDDRPF
jgi:hypothetical protein